MNTIYNELVKEFGLEITSHNPANRPAMTMKQASYINAKYPHSEELSMRPSAKAIYIAERYGSLSVLWGAK
jgi:hypothetical protein